MMFRGVALRGLDGFTRGVTDDFAAGGAAKHCGRGSPARVLAMREAQLAAAFRAAAAWPGLERSVTGHRFKRTTSTTREAATLAA